MLGTRPDSLKLLSSISGTGRRGGMGEGRGRTVEIGFVENGRGRSRGVVDGAAVEDDFVGVTTGPRLRPGTGRKSSV